MFNALVYTQQLEKAGFTREQAETSLNVLIEIMTEQFATKSDLKELELRMESRFLRLESTIRELENRMTIKLGTITAVALGLAVTLQHLFPVVH
jgi:hypothetical protein